MGARVIELLLNNPGTSYFFAFGAGHFVGENTILDVVRNSGFNVEHVGPEDELNDWLATTHRRHHKGRKHKIRKGTVSGTFDDLSDEEKTKAFLQLLEYQQRVEKEQRDEQKVKERKEYSFHELWQRLPAHHIDPIRETDEDRSARQSVQVWYGISGGSSGSAVPQSAICTLLLISAFLALLFD